MRIKTITPLHVTEEELARRQERYSRLAPAPLQMRMANLPSDAPPTLGTAEACRASDTFVYDEAMQTDSDHFDAIFLDCVLDPSSEQLEKESPLPVFSLLKLSAMHLASLGYQLAAVTRNQVIADELEAKIHSYGLTACFHGTIVLNLSYEDVADDAKWNAALASAKNEAKQRGATALINGCSAVNVDEQDETILIVDPTDLALKLIAFAQNEKLLTRKGMIVAST